MSWRASSGVRAWMAQRVSGVYLAACFVAIAFAVLGGDPVTYEQWRALFTYPAVNIAAVLFFLALAMHAWVGVRDVVIDYVHVAVLRFVLLGLTAATLIVATLWSLRVLWSLPV